MLIFYEHIQRPNCFKQMENKQLLKTENTTNQTKKKLKQTHTQTTKQLKHK